MLCQNCGKQQATTHIKRIINGDAEEHHLCSSCAQQLGYGDMLSGFSMSLDDIFGGLLGDTRRMLGADKNVQRCPKCGNSFADIVRDSRLGCADCYRTFYDKLKPTLERLHGRATHNGKRIEVSAVKPHEESKEEKIEKLRAELASAVEAQEFEQAAKLRDEIRGLE